MRTVSQVIKFRQNRYKQESHSPWPKLGLIGGGMFSLVIALLVLFGIQYYLSVTQNLPSIDLIPSLLEPPSGTLLQPSRLYDRTSQHIILSLQNPARTNSQYVYFATNGENTSNQALRQLENATIAVSDPGFWEEPGYSLGGIVQGTHSTLAQKLVVSLVLFDEQPSITRSLRERLLAAQLTEKYGPEKVMEWYLNSARYGKFTYGVDAASLAYFNKPVEDLSLAEVSMLVALEMDPFIDPLSDYALLKERQVEVLGKMRDLGYVNSDELEQSLRENIQFQPQLEPESLSPAFTNLVLQQLSQEMPLQRIYRGGFEIITSLDYGLQSQVQCASQVQLARISGNLAQVPVGSNQDCEAADRLRSSQQTIPSQVQGLATEVVILDPNNGQILALLANGENKVIPAFPDLHPAGTILSPFLYLTAFTQGMSPASLLWDIPLTEMGGSGLDLGMAEQPDYRNYHGPVSLRAAFANNYSGAALEVYNQVGAANVWQVKRQFGINSSETISPSFITLDDFYSQSASLLGVVHAYAALAHEGVMKGHSDTVSSIPDEADMLTPTALLTVKGPDGKIWLDWAEPESVPVATSQLAYLITDALSDEDVRQFGSTQADILDIGRPVAIKVGASQDYRASWVVGYTPQLVVGLWMGESQEAMTGSSTDLSIDLWQAITRIANKDMPVQEFAEPTGLSRVVVCVPTGMLASPLCPQVREEVFLSGNEPTQVDNLYQEYLVDRATGLLATIFTPADLIDKKVYLSIPDVALEWSRQTVFPQPPARYDEGYLPPPASPQIGITAPTLFKQVSGKISLFGNANGNNFDFYRLQAGVGLNPKQWLQVGEDTYQPVTDGLLGIWDTTGLQGFYIIELLVVMKDKQIQQYYLPVMVDNELPQVQIVTPLHGEEFSLSMDKSIILRADATDDNGINRVEFVLDHQLIATSYEFPYVVIWPAISGEHDLQVAAFDEAGNQHEVSIKFTIKQ